MELLGLIIITLAILLVPASAVSFPSSIPKCKAGDNECVARSLQNILQQHVTGVPEIGIGSIDPMHFTNLDISTGGQGSVDGNLTINAGMVKGWKAMQVKKVTGFNKDPKQNQIELHVFVPKDTIVGKYTVKGRLLLVPIVGSGDVIFIFDDLRMVVKIKTKVQTRNGEEYLVIKNVFCDIDVRKSFMNFTNLFNNKDLSDNMNVLLNQNEKLLFHDTKHAFGVARGKVLRDFLRPVFEKMPYRMFFSD